MPPGLSSRKAESPPEVFFDAPAYLALAHLLQSLARSHNCDDTVFGIIRRFCASSRGFQPGAQPARGAAGRDLPNSAQRGCFPRAAAGVAKGAPLASRFQIVLSYVVESRS